MLWRREISVALLGIRPQFLGCVAHNLVNNGPGNESCSVFEVVIAVLYEITFK